MNIAIHGLGYVGTVLLAYLSSLGHFVNGYDVDESKTELLSRGHSPFSEPGVEELLTTHRYSYSVYSSSPGSLNKVKATFICVGTPYRHPEGLDYSYITRCIDTICLHAQVNPQLYCSPHPIFIRSTIDALFYNRLTRYYNAAYPDHPAEFFFVAFPEFLREGSALEDITDTGSLNIYFSPAYQSLVSSILSDLFPGHNTIPTSLSAATSIKMVSNSWHALKVAFTNEVSRVLHSSGLDSADVFRVFALDHKLNISSAYMKPGFAFGGSCLPKDLNGLVSLGRTNGIDTPLLSSTLASNPNYINDVISEMEAQSFDSLYMYGLSFKEGTDDLRNSPFLKIALHFCQSKSVFIYDKCLSESSARNAASRSAYMSLGSAGDSMQSLADFKYALSKATARDVFVVCHKLPAELIEMIASLPPFTIFPLGNRLPGTLPQSQVTFV